MKIDKIIETIKNSAEKDYALWVAPLLQVTEGGYGEQDKLYGVRTPILRKIAKEYYDIPYEDIKFLLSNEYHEVRLLALMILIHKFKTNKYDRDKIVRIYVDNAEYINNWDLVDLSAANILGNYIYDNPEKLNMLNKLSDSEHLWKQRIAIVSTHYLIKKGFYEPTIKLSEKYINHSHHLIHKAVGWTLRELGKKDIKELYSFLDKYSAKMPRVMLRYAIERLPEIERQSYMKR